MNILYIINKVNSLVLRQGFNFEFTLQIYDIFLYLTKELREKNTQKINIAIIYYAYFCVSREYLSVNIQKYPSRSDQGKNRITTKLFTNIIFIFDEYFYFTH